MRQLIINMWTDQTKFERSVRVFLTAVSLYLAMSPKLRDWPWSKELIVLINSLGLFIGVGQRNNVDPGVAKALNQAEPREVKTMIEVAKDLSQGGTLG